MGSSRQMTNLLVLAMGMVLIVLLVLNYFIHGEIEATNGLPSGYGSVSQEEVKLRERAGTLLKKQEETIVALTQEIQVLRREQSKSAAVASSEASRHQGPDLEEVRPLRMTNIPNLHR